MQEREGSLKSHPVFAAAKVWLMALMVAVLVADLPLTCIYGLEAQLHRVSGIQDDTRPAGTAATDRQNPPFRGVAFNIERHAVLQRSPAKTSLSVVTLITPSHCDGIDIPKWVVVWKYLPHDDHLDHPRLPRPYDPLGPPLVSL